MSWLGGLITSSASMPGELPDASAQPPGGASAASRLPFFFFLGSSTVVCADSFASDTTDQAAGDAAAGFSGSIGRAGSDGAGGGVHTGSPWGRGVGGG